MKETHYIIGNIPNIGSYYFTEINSPFHNCMSFSREFLKDYFKIWGENSGFFGFQK